MDSMFSVDEMVKMRHKDFEDEIEAMRTYKLVKTSQSYRPGITERIIVYVLTLLGEIVSKLKCFFTHNTVTNYRNQIPRSNRVKVRDWRQ